MTQLQGWKGKMFSIGGCDILIKVVAQAIPSYTMSIFRLLAEFCNRLRSVISNFWWSGTDEEQRIYWSKWSLLCRSKNQSEMGFHDLTYFNQSLLAKQA